MKKNSRFLLVMIASLCAISSTVSLQAAEMPIQEIEVEYAQPVFSFGQVRELKNNFVSWLHKHYRCLYAGKCTRAEKAQVTAEWSRWIKRLGFTVVVGLALYFGKPKAQQAAQHVSQQMQKMHPAVVIAAVLDELLAEHGDISGQPLNPAMRRARLAKFTGQISQASIDGIVESIEKKILAEDSDPIATPLTASERRQRMMDITQNAVKAALAIPAGEEIGREGVAGYVVKQVLEELGTREVALPLGRRVSLVPSTRAQRKVPEGSGEPESVAAESAEGSYPEEEEYSGASVDPYEGDLPY